MKLHLPKALFAAVLACFNMALAVTITPTGGTTSQGSTTININFDAGRGTLAEKTGTVTINGLETEPSQWTNITVPNNGTQSNVDIATASGLHYYLSYSALGSWAGSGEDLDSTLEGTITKGYLDISNAGGKGITLSIVNEAGLAMTDWEKIHVILSGDGGQYGGVIVNGTSYCYIEGALTEGNTAWGTRSGNTEIEEGTNLMVIERGDTIPTGLVLQANAGSNRSSIAGLQVVGKEATIFRAESCAIADLTEGQSTAVSAISPGADYLFIDALNTTVTATEAEGDRATLNVDRDLTVNTLAVTGGTLGYNISTGKALTVKTALQEFRHVVTGGGTLNLAMANTPEGGANKNLVILGEGSDIAKVRIASGVLATNVNNGLEDHGHSTIGAADLYMATGTTYVVRNGGGDNANITSGTMYLEGTLALRCYGSLGNNCSISSNIAKAPGVADTSIDKTDTGTIALTGTVNAGTIKLSEGNLKLGGDVTVDRLQVSRNTLTLTSGSNVTVNGHLRLSENGNDGNKIVIEEGATLTINGTNNSHDTNASLLLAHWGKTGFMEINGGTLEATRTQALMNWDGTGTLSINAGTAKLLGINFWAQNNGNNPSFRGTLNLGTAETGTGVLELGDTGIVNAGGASVINLGNGTILAAADTNITRNPSYASGTVNLIGIADGTTFNTNGHNITVTHLDVAGGGNLVKEGEGSLIFNNALNASGNITVTEGTLQLNGATTISRTITNASTIAFGENATLALDSLANFEGKVNYVDPLATGSQNGYLGDSNVQIINNSTGASITGLETATVAGETYTVTVTDAGASIQVRGGEPGGSYYVNEGVVEYGAASNSAYADSTTGLFLAGGTLKLAKDLKEGVDINVAKASTLEITEGVSLAKGRVVSTDTVTLAGSGEYSIGSALNLPTNVVLGSDWTGTVVVSGVEFSGNYANGNPAANSSSRLGNLATANSFVGLTGCTGWLAPDFNTNSVNLNLLAGDVPAIKLIDGSSDKNIFFNGKIKGEGDFEVNMAGKGCTNIAYNFNGDISEWTGAFRALAPGAKNFTVRFEGSTDINAALECGTGFSLNATIGGASDRAINNDITNEGTLNLTVNGAGAKTFKKGLAATSMTVVAGTDVTLEGTTNVGTLTANDAITNSGTLTVGTLTTNTTIANTGSVTINTAASASNTSGLELKADASTIVQADGTTPSTDGNGFISSGIYYVVKSNGGTLALAEGVTLGEGYSIAGQDLLYSISTEAPTTYFIYNSTTYNGGDAANVATGKTIQIMDGANLTVTSVDNNAVTAGVIFKTQGSGSLTLDLNALKDVGAIQNVLKNNSTPLGHLVLASGTEIQLTSSTNQPGWLAKASTIEVKDGASFSHRVNNTATNASISFLLEGEGRADDPEAQRGALVLAQAPGSDHYTIAGKVELTGDATICVSGGSSTSRRGVLSGEFTGNGHVLTKTGVNELYLGNADNSPFTGADKTMDAGLNIREGSVRIQFTGADIATAGAESHKISGLVTIAGGAKLHVFTGYTELSGGLKVEGNGEHASVLQADFARGLKISGNISGGADAVLNLTRDQTGRANEILAVTTDNSAEDSFAGTYNATGNWTLRADHENAFAKATVNLAAAGAYLTFGDGVENIKLTGLNGAENTGVTGAGSIHITGAGNYTYAGTMSEVTDFSMDGTGTQTLAGIKEGANLAVGNGGTLAFTNAITAGDISLDNGTINGEGMVTLAGTLSGQGMLNKLTTTAESAIALDLAAATHSSAALITATSVNAAAGKIALNLAHVDALTQGYYNLLSWAGISADQFDLNLSGAELVVDSATNTLRLFVLPDSLYWKGTDHTWSANNDAEWAMSPDGAAEVAFVQGVEVNFVGAGDTIAVGDDGVAVSTMNVSGGDWGFSGGSITAEELNVASGSVTLGKAIIGTDVISGNAKVTTGNAAFSLGSATTTVENGAIATDADTVNAALTGVALTLTGDATINGTQNLKTLNNGGNTTIAGDVTVTANGGVQLAGGKDLTISGSLTNDNLTITGKDGGAATITAETNRALSLWNGKETGGLTISDAAIADTTVGRVIYATLDNVDYTNVGGAELHGTQNLSSLTAGGDVKVIGGTTTIGDTAIAGGTINTGNVAFDIAADTTTLKSCGITTSASTIGATIADSILNATADELVFTGTQSLSELTTSASKVTINGSTSVDMGLALKELAGTGVLEIGSAEGLSLAKASSIGTLNATSVALGAGATLNVGNLNLTGTGDTLTITSLKGIGASNLLLNVTDSFSGVLTIAGIDKDILKDATFDDNNVMQLGYVKGLTGITAIDPIEDKGSKTIYTVTADGDQILVTAQTDAKGWKDNTGTWSDGDDTEFSGGLSETDTAGFLGNGSDTVTITGSDKTVASLVVDIASGSSIDEYTLTATEDKTITATESVLIKRGDLTVEENVTINTGELHVNDEHGSLVNKGTITVDGVVVGDNITNDGTMTLNGQTTGAIVNNGELTLSDGSQVLLTGTGDLTSSGAVKLTDGSTVGGTLNNIGALTLESDTTIGALKNTGSIDATGKTLTLNTETTAGGTVTADTLALASGSNTFTQITVGETTVAADDSLTVSGAAKGTITNNGELSVGTGSDITLKGSGDLAATGNADVALAEGATIESLTTVENATVTVTSGDKTLSIDSLDGTGSLVATGKTLSIGGTAADSAMSVEAATLDVAAGGATDLTLGNVTVDTIVFEKDNVSEDTPLLSATSVTATTGAVTFKQSDLDNLLDENVYELMQAATVDSSDYKLDTAMLTAYHQAGMAASLTTLPIQMYSLSDSDSTDPSSLYLVVVEDTERTWNTSQSTVKDAFGNDVLGTDGNPLDMQDLISGYDAYNSLDNIHAVVVDADATIDLSHSNPTEAGLTIENLQGDNAGATLSVVGYGDGSDVVTLLNTEDTTMAGKLVLDSLNVSTEGATLDLGTLELTGTNMVTGDSKLTVGNITMDTSSLEATDLKATTIELTNASSLSGKAIEVGTLTGTQGNTLSGNVTVTNAWDYTGSYGDTTTVTLQTGKPTTMTTDSKLTVKGTGQNVTLSPTEGGEYTIGGFNMQKGTLTLATAVKPLKLQGNSALTNGTLVLGVDVQNPNVSQLFDAAGKTLDLSGTNVVLNQVGTMDPENLDTSKLTDISLASLAGTVVTDSKTSVSLVGSFFERYYTNASVKDGQIVVDLATDYYETAFDTTDTVADLGIQMLDHASITNMPQYKGDTFKDQKGVLDALDTYKAAGDNAGASKLASSVAGAGTVAAGIALSGDMDRQLRAIRNRTTTMGVSDAYVHESLPTFNAWINAESDYRKMDADASLAGFSLMSWGGTVGMDVDLTSHFTAGMALTAMYGDLKADSTETDAKGDMDTYYVSLFGRYAASAWVHTFVASVGMADVSMDRTVNHAAGSYKTQGSTNGMSIGLMYELGYTVALNEEGSSCLQPIVNIAFKHTQLDGYTETGSDMALEVGDQTMTSVTLGIGSRFQSVVGENLYNRASILELRALAKLETGDRDSSATVEMAKARGVSGTVKSAEADAFGIELGAGITIPVGQDSGALFIDASAELRGSYTNYNGTVGYRINF